MASKWDRPDPRLVLARFKDLVNDPLLSASHLRKKREAIAAHGQAALRSLYWRVRLQAQTPDRGGDIQRAIYLNVLPASPSTWSASVRRQRRQWTDLAYEYLRDPDGTWVAGAQNFAVDDNEHANGHPNKPNPRVFDPLGSERGNPWPSWYGNQELWRTIQQDVDRTFPDIPYFRDALVQQSMANMLFVFSRLHSDIGYRQGMHEILAIVLWCVDADSLASDPGHLYSSDDWESLAVTILDRGYVVHDAYAVFSTLMVSMLSWYDPAQTVSASQVPGSLQPAGPMVQPIVAKCAKIHEMLKRVDVELWKRMEEFKVEPQIYGLKWIRLLFSREFPLNDALQIWDALFADGDHNALSLVDYVCLAMLLRIRESLLDADYSHFLQGLLRYPSLPGGDQRIQLLLQQASYLRDNTTNFGGAYVRRQNQQNRAEAGEKSGTRAHELAYNSRATTPSGKDHLGKAQVKVNNAGFLDQGKVLADGLYERAEALGINKTLFSTLGELRKTVAAYQQQQQPPSNPTMSEIPARPSWESQPAQNNALDLKRVKMENIAMGTALSANLQTLRSHFGWPATDDIPPDVSDALHKIEHISEVLVGRSPRYNSASASRTANLKNESEATGGSAQRNLMDEESPLMSSSPSFPVIYYPRTPSKSPVIGRDQAGHDPLPALYTDENSAGGARERQAQPSLQQQATLPQVPAASHRRSSSTASTSSFTALQYPSLGLSRLRDPLANTDTQSVPSPFASRGVEGLRIPDRMASLAIATEDGSIPSSRSKSQATSDDPLGAFR